MKLDVHLPHSPVPHVGIAKAPIRELDTILPNDALVNPIHPSVEDKLDKQVKAIYLRYQGGQHIPTPTAQLQSTNMSSQ